MTWPAAMPGLVRIASLRLGRAGGAFAGDVRNARASWAQRASWWVVLEDGEGRIGLGEAAPLPGMSPDTLEEAEAALRAAAPGVVGQVIDLRSRLADLRVVPPDSLSPIDAVVRRALEGHRSPSARFALETAILDACALALGEPAERLLPGGDRPEAHHDVEVSALLGSPHGPAAVARARSLVDEGARTLKVKVGARSWEEDADALGALRAAVGPGIGLFADANGVWSCEEARAALRAFAVHHVAFVEQPVRPSELVELGACAVDVWADESLTEVATRREALEAPHVAGLACKPTVVGGFVASLELARAARDRGKGFAITHTLEGPIALAACGVLARALAGEAPRAGLWPHEALAAFTAVEPPSERGTLRRPQHAGLGFSPEDRARLLATARVEATWAS